MPRIENSGDNVTDWCNTTGNGSSTHDVCKSCYSKLANKGKDAAARLAKGLYLYNGDPVGSDGWVGDIDHPPYEEEDYSCSSCGKKLTARDNG